ncbi:MAG TPA: zf-HC2 domain-containing protein [bacterium]|nr:zf-HC2 domain-containing protein [bacterium]
MVETKCDMNELFIEQYADNELDLRESSEVSIHLGSCVSCKKRYEEIIFAKNAVNRFNSLNKLSLIEKEGFYSFIDQHSSKYGIVHKFFEYLRSHGFTVAVSTVSFTSLVFAFVFSLSQIEKENNLIIKEIIAAHNNLLPYDFDTPEKTETELNKKFTIDKKTLLNLASISPVLRGRFTSIAATPAAKISIKGLKEEEKGTLFLSKNNAHIKNVFEDGTCLVKSSDNNCKAKLIQKQGNDMIHWEELDNDFVFVTDNNRMSAQMVQLISNY